jgi:hypothetical protein
MRAYIFRIKPSGGGKHRDIAVLEDQTFDVLHKAICGAFKLQPTDMYSFNFTAGSASRIWLPPVAELAGPGVKRVPGSLKHGGAEKTKIGKMRLTPRDKFEHTPNLSEKTRPLEVRLRQIDCKPTGGKYPAVTG